MIKSRIIPLVVCLLLAICGCAQIGAPTTAPTATHTAVPTATATSTATLTATSTATAIPTATATLTATPTSTPSPTPTQTPVPLAAELELGQLQVIQGQVAELRVMANMPCQVSASLETRPLPFTSRDGHTHWGLLSVHALAETGRVPLTITVRTAEGQEISLATSIEVLPGTFAHETLDFEPETEKLLDPEITQPELLRVAAVYGESAFDKGWAGVFVWPVQGRVTSAFGTRRNYDGHFSSYHAGIDLGSTGDDVIRAPANGVVRLADKLQVRGNAIIIDHGAGVLSGYYHLARIDVESGQSVTQGEAIGLMGATGLVTGAHLHWELRVGGIAVNPALWTQLPYLAEIDAPQSGG